MEKFKFKHDLTPDLEFTAIDDGEKWVVLWEDEDGKGYIDYSYSEASTYLNGGFWVKIND